MAKKQTWQACLQQEIIPSLPLHDPSQGWLPVKYCDGTSRKVDLTTLLKDLHLIADLELGHTSVNVSMYRILLAMLYRLVDMPNRVPSDFAARRLELVRTNPGLNPQVVDGYFQEFEDRFYLLHPSTPFLQDASLYTTILGVDELNDENSAKVRTQLTKFANDGRGSVRNMHPLGVSPADREKDPTWGLPALNYLEADDPQDVVTSNMMTLLLYQRYSHSATGAKGRRFFDQGPAKQKSNDTYPAAHSLRCAVNYVIAFPSLYQTLIFAMDFFSVKDRMDEIPPEWEEDVDPSTGYLQGLGSDREYSQVADTELPRSSVNMTHQSLVMVPQYDPHEDRMAPNGGLINTLRSVLFNFKHEKSDDGSKLPSPLTWNPFVVRKNGRGKVLKTTEPLSAHTYISDSRLPRVLAGSADDMVKPSPLRRMEDHEVRKALAGIAPMARIMIASGDAAQSKEYASFVITTKETGQLADDPEMVERVDEWLDKSGKMKAILEGNIKDTFGKTFPAEGAVDAVNEFWSFYSDLFDDSMTREEIKDIKNPEVYREIRNQTARIFDDKTSAIALSKPLIVQGHKGKMMASIHNLVLNKGRHALKS